MFCPQRKHHASRYQKGVDLTYSNETATAANCVASLRMMVSNFMLIIVFHSRKAAQTKTKTFGRCVKNVIWENPILHFENEGCIARAGATAL